MLSTFGPKSTKPLHESVLQEVAEVYNRDLRPTLLVINGKMYK